MSKYYQYLKYIVRHKWWVMYYCFRDGLIWRGITHDWHKFLPSEYIPYAKFFYGKKIRDKTGYYKPTDTGDFAFDFAWLLHQKRADHHWQWWVLPEDGGGVKVLAMSDHARREMICDWRGAGKAQGTPDTLKWWMANNHKMQLHPNTREWIEHQFGDAVSCGSY
jgi:hypothetical protein